MRLGGGTPPALSMGMVLSPVTKTRKPLYPTHRRRTSAAVALARSLAAAAAVGALWLGGCYAHTGPEEEPQPPVPPIPEEPEEFAGGMAAPAFHCEEVPAWDSGWAPGYIEGSLCGAESAFATVQVSTEGRYRFTVSLGEELVFISLQDADGLELGTLEPGGPPLEVDLPASTYVLEATAADPIGNPAAWIGVSSEAI